MLTAKYNRTLRTEVIEVTVADLFVATEEDGATYLEHESGKVYRGDSLSEWLRGHGCADDDYLELQWSVDVSEHDASFNCDKYGLPSVESRTKWEFERVVGMTIKIRGERSMRRVVVRPDKVTAFDELFPPEFEGYPR